MLQLTGMPYTKIGATLMFAVLVAGCSTMPAFGPTSSAIVQAAKSEGGDILPFRVVDVSASTVPNTTAAVPRFPAPFLRQGLRTADEVIGVGDDLKIVIWEMAEDGLFASAGHKETVFEVRVSNAGQIKVPYTQRLTVVGLTAADLRVRLLKLYKGQVVEPEITVQISHTPSRAVAVLGAVKSPGSLFIEPGGVRLLDLLARAGGAVHAAWEVEVTVQREGSAATLLLADILHDTANNIVVLPGDIVSLAYVPRRFAVYGGVARPGNIEFPNARADLAHLLTAAGGLDNFVSAAQSVYVFRPSPTPGDLGTATAYRVDFSRPDAFFLSSAFRLEPSDITYVASARAADFHKILTILFSPLLGTVSQTRNLGE